MTSKERTLIINKLQRKYPNTRRQRSYHGANVYSVQFFCRATNKLVADFTIKGSRVKESL